MTRRYFNPTTGKIYRTAGGRLGQCVDENPVFLNCCGFNESPLPRNSAGKTPPDGTFPLYALIIGGPFDGWPIKMPFAGGLTWTGSNSCGGIDCGLGLSALTVTLSCGTGDNSNRFQVTSSLGPQTDQPTHEEQTISCFCDTLTADYGPFVSHPFGDCPSYSWRVKILCTELCEYSLNGTIPTGYDIDISGATNTTPTSACDAGACAATDGIYDASTAIPGTPCSFLYDAAATFQCTASPLSNPAFDTRAILQCSTRTGPSLYQLQASVAWGTSPSRNVFTYDKLQTSPIDLSVAHVLTLYQSSIATINCTGPASITVTPK